MHLGKKLIYISPLISWLFNDTLSVNHQTIFPKVTQSAGVVEYCFSAEG